MAELYDQFLPFKWRDVEVPLMKVDYELAHDLVEHRPHGVNGGNIEDTGIAPQRWIATIPFINNIACGPNESWPSGKLFPNHLHTFQAAFADNTQGLLQHPIYGRIACRAEKMSYTLSGDLRNGVIVTASFVETLDDEVLMNEKRPTIELQSEAVDFDGQQKDLLKIVPQLPVYKETLEDLSRKIASVGDNIALLEYRSAGRIKSIIFQVDRVQQSITRAKNALTWPATQQAQRIKAAAIDLEVKILQSQKAINLFTVEKDTTVAGLIPQLAGSKIGDLIRLNPELMGKPVVLKGTVVRYYTPQAA